MDLAAEKERLIGRLPGAEAFEAEYPGALLLSSMLSRAIERLGLAVSGRVGAVWKHHGLSHPAGNALAVIEGTGRAMTPGEISAAMHITSGSITSLLDTLEGRDLIRRFAHDEDRRKVLVDITPQAQRILDEALPSIQLVVRELFADVALADQRSMLALVEQLHASTLAHDTDVIPAGVRHRPERLARQEPENF